MKRFSLPAFFASALIGSLVTAAGVILTLRWSPTDRDEAVSPQNEYTLPAPPPSKSAADVPAADGAPSAWLVRAQGRAAIANWLEGRDSDGTTMSVARRTETLRALLVVLGPEEWPFLLEPLATREQAEAQNWLRIAFDIWAERAPEAAARWAGSLPAQTKANRNLLCRIAGLNWAKSDRMAAASWAASLPDEALARNIAPALIAGLATHDLDRAKLLAEARGPEFAMAMYPAIMNALAQNDPAAAVRLFGPRLWSDSRGNWQLGQSVGLWMQRDAKSALAWLAAQPATHDHMLGNLLHGVSRSGDGSPARVLDALVQTDEFSGRQNALGQMFFQWGTDKPEEAMAWLDGLADPHLRSILLERASRTTYSERPQASLPMALRMSEGGNRDDRIKDLLQKWSALDLPATLAWMEANPDPAVRKAAPGVQATLLAGIALDEPETAVETWATLSDPAVQEAALMPLARAWAKTDPGAALMWLEQQGADKINLSRNGDLPQMVYAWSKRDPEAALRWAEARHDADSQRNALRAMAGQYYGDKPERAGLATLYTQVKDPALRAAALEPHLREWMGKDRAGATAWLEANRATAPDLAKRLLALP